MRIFDYLILASMFPAMALTQPPYPNITTTEPTRVPQPPTTGPTSRSPTTTPSPIPLVSTPDPVPTTTRSPQELESLVVSGLVDVPSVGSFASLVLDQPSIFSALDLRWDYDILAPDNSAEGFRGDIGNGSVNPQLALAFVERKPGDPALTDKPRVLETALRDTKYANLGPNEGARLVSFPDGPNITILAGMGKSVTFSGDGEPYNAGDVHVGEGYFTLPEDLSTTLTGTNGTAFEKFLADSGQLETLTTTPHITIFALSDEAFTAAGSRLNKAALNSQVIRDVAGYTPDFVSGTTLKTDAGGTIMITMDNGVYFANNIKITMADRIMKNGVVHYVADVIPHSVAGRPSISPFVTILAVAAALVRYA